MNTQAVLLELRREDVLTDEEYSSLIARLALLNYRFVRVEAGDILRLLEANRYMTDEGVGALRMTLRGRECTNESAVAVVAGLIAALVQQGLPVQQETLLVSVLLGDLRHGREMTTALVEVLDCARRNAAERSYGQGASAPARARLHTNSGRRWGLH